MFRKLVSFGASEQARIWNAHHREHRSSDAARMAATGPRTYSFRVTVTVEPDDPAYHDPEWAADAAAGVLSNVDGYECLYDEVAEVDALPL